MAQTYPFDTTDPDSATTDAKDIGAEIRQVKIMLQELLNQIIGVTESTPIVDPVINGTTVKNLTAITAALTTPSILNVLTKLTVNGKLVLGAAVRSTIGNPTLTIDLATATIYLVDWNSNGVTVQINNAENYMVWHMLLKVNNTGYSLTWPSNVKWDANGPPVAGFTSNYKISFLYDGTNHVASWTKHTY